MSRGLSLGCSMIVKNSENTIERAIRSVEPFCNQIVVVDTGSLDATPSIASRLGAEVHFFEWTNNFSEARNYSLKFIRTEWVIVLDSDEELIGESLIKNYNLFNIENAGGIRLILRNFLSVDKESDYENSIIEHKYPRIFRKKSSDGLILPIKFDGVIHEQISESIISSGYKILDSDICIIHYGYFEKNEEKINRNLNLIRSELQKNPEDIWMLYHLAETEFGAGNYQEAGKIFRNLNEKYQGKENELSIPSEHYEMTRLRLAQIELKNNNFNEIESLLNFSSSEINREGFRNYLRMVAFLLSGNFDLARELLGNQSFQLTNIVTQKQKDDLKLAIEKISQSQKNET